MWIPEIAEKYKQFNQGLKNKNEQQQTFFRRSAQFYWRKKSIYSEQTKSTDNMIDIQNIFDNMIY